MLRKRTLQTKVACWETAVLIDRELTSGTRELTQVQVRGHGPWPTRLRFRPSVSWVVETHHCELTSKAGHDAHVAGLVREGPAIDRWGNVVGYDRDTPVGSGPETLTRPPAAGTRGWARLRWQADPMNLILFHQRKQKSSLYPPSSSNSHLPTFWGKKLALFPHQPLNFHLLPQASDHATDSPSWLCLQFFFFFFNIGV